MLSMLLVLVTSHKTLWRGSIIPILQMRKQAKQDWPIYSRSCREQTPSQDLNLHSVSSTQTTPSPRIQQNKEAVSSQIRYKISPVWLNNIPGLHESKSEHWEVWFVRYWEEGGEQWQFLVKAQGFGLYQLNCVTSIPDHYTLLVTWSWMQIWQWPQAPQHGPFVYPVLIVHLPPVNSYASPRSPFNHLPPKKSTPDPWPGQSPIA